MRDQETARLHEMLQEIHAEMQDPANWHNRGICSTLGAKKGSSLFYRLSRKWPEHSGNPAFPVPSPRGSKLSPSFTFLYNPAIYHWDRESSEYAELRWQLLEWLIEETKP